MVAGGIASIQNHVMNGDNTWHFRWAGDIFKGRQLFWNGCDANRIFPDLVFGVLARSLPQSDNYTVWLQYYAGIEVLALCASLYFLVRQLCADETGRLFLFTGFAAIFVAVTASLYFWRVWTLDPGNHGGALCIVFLLLALSLRMGARPAQKPAAFSAFVIAGALAVLSNRYLAVCFLAPLALASLPVRASWQARASQAAAPVAACLAGLLAQKYLNHSFFYSLVAPAREPDFSRARTLAWLAGRISKETSAAWGTDHQLALATGLLLLVAAAAYAIAAFLPARAPGRNDEGAHIAGIVAGISALACLLFMIVMVEDEGSWRYRYMTVPFWLSALLAVIWVHSRIHGPAQRGLIFLAAFLFPISLAYSYASGKIEQTREYVARLDREVSILAKELASQPGAEAPSGLANYWPTHEIAAYSGKLSLLPLNGDGFYNYNNNSLDLCNKRLSFVLNWDTPGRGAILNLLGEPLAVRRADVGKFKNIEVMFYEPATLEERVLKPARQKAKAQFPGFNCPKEAKEARLRGR
jgi:hypothetical protein